MSENMNLSVNGHSKVPPGFRFHPTEEELLHYYLRKKVASHKIDLDVIRDVDLNKLEPWDIQEKCRIGSTPQNDWYFFSHKDKKYPTGTRTNRATNAGFWKATGRDKTISSSLRRIGMRKTLVFYRGRAPHGLKSDWIMHEYRLDDNSQDSINGSNIGDSGPEEDWVVCRVFKKKNYHKALDGPLLTTTSTSPNDAVLSQILSYMGARSSSSNSCKQENQLSIINADAQIFPDPITSAPFAHLPELLELSHGDYDNKPPVQDLLTIGPVHEPNDWVALDRLVASQLNGQFYSGNMDHQLSCNYNASENNNFNDQDLYFAFEHPNHDETEMVNHNSEMGNDGEYKVSSTDIDFWTGIRSSSSLVSSSSSDPLSHLSV